MFDRKTINISPEELSKLKNDLYETVLENLKKYIGKDYAIYVFEQEMPKMVKEGRMNRLVEAVVEEINAMQLKGGPHV